MIANNRKNRIKILNKIYCNNIAKKHPRKFIKISTLQINFLKKVYRAAKKINKKILIKL